MMDWNGDWSWEAWVGMSLMMAIVWGTVAWALVTVVRRPRSPEARSATEILDERLARGEITVDEYEQLRRALHPGGPSPSIR